MTVAATIIVETVTSEKAKRTRKTHHKVRSGCITCKIRRKKCDEAKPHCKRCTSTGRKCDGYDIADNQTASTKSIDRSVRKPWPTNAAATDSNSPDSGIDVSCSKSTTQSPKSKTISSASSDTDSRLLLSPLNRQSLFANSFVSPADQYSFSFFQYRTGPEFAAYFDSSIWRSFILRAALQHPTVMAAATAVGAVHRRFELGITPEAFAFCEIADAQYARANKLLSLDLASNHPSAPEIFMLTHMLLSVFEAFQGEDDKALYHMTVGLKQVLFSRPTVTTQRSSRYKALQVGYTPLYTFIASLESLARKPVFFGNTYTQLTDPALFVDPTPIPAAFTSLCEARDFLFTESLWIWSAWHELSLGTNFGGFATQHTHIARLLQWSMAYAEYSKITSSPTAVITPASSDQRNKERKQSQLLKLYRETLYLILLTQLAFHDSSSGAEIVPLCFPPESCDCHRSCRDYAERKSALNAHFARLVVLSDSLFGYAESATPEGVGNNSGRIEYDTDQSMSVDTGIGPPLWRGEGGERCRSTKVRHQVVGLLGQERLSREVYGKMGVYSIAEKLSAVEEHAIVAAGGLEGLVGRKQRDANNTGRNMAGIMMGKPHSEISSTPAITTTSRDAMAQNMALNMSTTISSPLVGPPSADIPSRSAQAQNMALNLPNTISPPLIGPNLTNHFHNPNNNSIPPLPISPTDDEAEFEEDMSSWFRGQPNWMAGTQGLGDPKWVDYTCFLEQGQLLVRYCREDELGGLVWTEEMVKFR